MGAAADGDKTARSMPKVVGKFPRACVQHHMPRQGVTKVAPECVQAADSPPLRRSSELVQRTRHPTPALVQHMGVDHRGRNVGVAEQFLHRADVVAAFEQVSGK